MDTLTTANASGILAFIHENPVYRTGVLSYEGSIVKETEKAIQFQVGEGKIWFPRSAITVGQTTVQVKKWFKYDDKQWKIIEPVSTFFS